MLKRWWLLLLVGLLPLVSSTHVPSGQQYNYGKIIAEIPSIGSLRFDQDIYSNSSSLSNLLNHITINPGFVDIDTRGAPELNVSADVTFFGLNYSGPVYVAHDGIFYNSTIGRRYGIGILSWSSWLLFTSNFSGEFNGTTLYIEDNISSLRLKYSRDGTFSNTTNGTSSVPEIQSDLWRNISLINQSSLGDTSVYYRTGQCNALLEFNYLPAIPIGIGNTFIFGENGSAGWCLEWKIALKNNETRIRDYVLSSERTYIPTIRDFKSKITDNTIILNATFAINDTITGKVNFGWMENGRVQRTDVIAGLKNGEQARAIYSSLEPTSSYSVCYNASTSLVIGGTTCVSLQAAENKTIAPPLNQTNSSIINETSSVNNSTPILTIQTIPAEDNLPEPQIIVPVPMPLIGGERLSPLPSVEASNPINYTCFSYKNSIFFTPEYNARKSKQVKISNNCKQDAILNFSCIGNLCSLLKYPSTLTVAGNSEIKANIHIYFSRLTTSEEHALISFYPGTEITVRTLADKSFFGTVQDHLSSDYKIPLKYSIGFIVVFVLLLVATFSFMPLWVSLFTSFFIPFVIITFLILRAVL